MAKHLCVVPDNLTVVRQVRRLPCPPFRVAPTRTCVQKRARLSRATWPQSEADQEEAETKQFGGARR